MIIVKIYIFLKSYYLYLGFHNESGDIFRSVERSDRDVTNQVERTVANL